MTSEENFRESIPLRRDSDVAKARVLISQWAQRQGFSAVEKTRAMTAVSEIARNCVTHGGGGSLHISVLYRGDKPGFRIQIVDQGRGIEDVELAMTRGYSTGSGLGLGLGGAKALCNRFSIESNAGKGTTVVMDYWR
ncbi:ATP-binding protein [Pelagicoccus sp. SDUM812003]|uniref:ATP-binding protein n=1 Tax=Pelagicoccus sp. SDUM812003 TaxID=3041267 RepID=UPI00280F21A8|nr:ATP-binding protein [Pelagicoccus sp. SDUM812003]MDQ8203991.1 ATP-binding protein [Pelagicoccus sp. SDUM812003]